MPFHKSIVREEGRKIGNEDRKIKVDTWLSTYLLCFKGRSLKLCCTIWGRDLDA